jgi:hypothetical protein
VPFLSAPRCGKQPVLLKCWKIILRSTKWLKLFKTSFSYWFRQTNSLMTSTRVHKPDLSSTLGHGLPNSICNHQLVPMACLHASIHEEENSIINQHAARMATGQPPLALLMNKPLCAQSHCQSTTIPSTYTILAHKMHSSLGRCQDTCASCLFSKQNASPIN